MNTNTTGRQLVDHWTWAAGKGLMNRNSALGLRAACAQVLSVLDNWEEIDVTSIDVEDLLKRFKNLRARDFNPSSLDAYEKRFRNAIASFLEYIRNPSAWKPASRAPRRQREANDESNGKNLESAAAVRVSSASERVEERGLIEYPFPLRDKLVARLMLPRDLTVADVKRLSGFMTALVVDQPDDQ